MNPQDDHQDTIQTSAYNPFPEPQTIPAGWDTSEFVSMPHPASVDTVGKLSEVESE